MKRLLKSIHWVRGIATILGLSLSAMIIISSWSEIKKFFENPSVSRDSLSIFLVFFFAGLAGFTAVKYKDYLLPQTITGKLAVIMGTILTIISWGFAVYTIFLLLVELLF
jgi:hypothetical protein